MADLTDAQLPGYFRSHCRTQRALFNGRHINRLLELAGHPADYVKSVSPNAWMSLGPSVIDPLCDLADKRALKNTETTT